MYSLASNQGHSGVCELRPKSVFGPNRRRGITVGRCYCSRVEKRDARMLLCRWVGVEREPGGTVSRINADGASRTQLWRRQTILMKHDANLPQPGAFPMASECSHPSRFPRTRSRGIFQNKALDM